MSSDLAMMVAMRLIFLAVNIWSEWSAMGSIPQEGPSESRRMLRRTLISRSGALETTHLIHEYGWASATR